MTRGIRLAAFDMDGTVLEDDSSWVAIHKHFGTSEVGTASLKLYSEGKIGYKEFMRRDISAWPKGVTRSEITEALSHYRVRKEAPETMARLRGMGVKVALVTSGIDILAQMVAVDLGIDHWIANGLVFDRKGILTGEGRGSVDPTRKDTAYLRFLDSIGINSKETIAVGDTIYDLAFLKSARLGFMLAHTTRVSDPEIVHIDRLTDVFQHIERNF